MLDVGGGHGQLAWPLANAGYGVTILGSDSVCRARVEGLVEDGRARFVTGDLVALPFKDGSFDVAMSFRLLPHVRVWGSLVSELARVARYAVVVDYPSSRSVNAFQGLSFGLKKRLEKDTRPFRVFSRGEIQEAFRTSGFEPTAERAQFLYPMALHRRLGSPAVTRALEGVAGQLGMTALFGSPVILRLERRLQEAPPDSKEAKGA